MQSDTLAGEYGGIGALITTDGSGGFFLAPFQDGPAADAGLVEGTQLLAIDGRPIEGNATLSQIVDRLRGIEGTSVRLRIRQPDEQRAETIEITRVNLPLPSVTDYLLPGYEDTGVVAISTFSDKTPGELERAVESLVQRGAKGLVLDLRNNGGGLLDSAVEVSRLFLREGIIVYEVRRGTVQATYEVQEPGRFVEIPLAAVVDSTTASAAEVVAAALQGNGRTLLIGATTFGKGSVQVIVELSDGSSMRITSSRWLTPADEMIDASGIEPDVNLGPEAAGTEQAILRAAELLNEGYKD
jgi:carboxyl-terminal processing protease